MRLQLYDQHNLAELDWETVEDGSFARKYHMPFLLNGTKFYISNVDTQLMLLQVDSLLLPVTVNHKEYENSYVVSPFTHYISYAKKELEALNKKWLSLPLQPVLTGLGYYLRACKINRVVIVNNWLVSTNLYPNLSEEQIEAITSFLVERFPDHAILFRSVNDFYPSGLVDCFLQQNYLPIPSRQVYFFDPRQETLLNSKTRWILKRDRKLLFKSGYRWVNGKRLSEEALQRLVELYELLYLDKYSIHNPQFQLSFLIHAMKQGFLHIYALEKEEEIDGVVGFFIQNGVMTTPFFGYDIHKPQKIGLYRMLSSLLVEKARERQLVLHESSGAASFKRGRGAFGSLEYTMAYVQHLPRSRRQAWQGLSRILQKIAVPILKKYKL
jgi:hypothetical protein